MVAGARSAQGTGRGRDRSSARSGNSSTSPRALCSAGTRSGFDAGRAAARPPSPVRPRPRAPTPRSRASRSAPMKRSTALTEVSTTHAVVPHGRRGGPQRGAAVRRVDLAGQRQLEHAGARPLERVHQAPRPCPAACHDHGATGQRALGDRWRQPRRRPRAATGPTTMTAGGPRSTSARPASVVRAIRWDGGRPAGRSPRRACRAPGRPAPARRRWRPGSSCP